MATSKASSKKAPAQKLASPAKKEPAVNAVSLVSKAVAAPKKRLTKHRATAKLPAVKLPPKQHKKDQVRRPITIVPKAPKPPLKKAEEATAFENKSKNLAFSFAERMKQTAREAEDTKDEQMPGVKVKPRPKTREKGATTLHFPAADLNEFRKRLVQLRQQVLGESSSLKSIALEQTSDHGCEDDDGADAFMRLQNLNQVDSKNRVIQKIDEALQHIDDGSYGICEVCGQLIRKPRLLNLPFAHTCLECQTSMEKGLGHADDHA